MVRIVDVLLVVVVSEVGGFGIIIGVVLIEWVRE